MPIFAVYTDKKENKIFLIYKEIQSGAVAKSYMRKGFPIYEEMRKYFPIYEEAISHVWLCNCSTLNFLIYEENLISFFISVLYCTVSFSLDDTTGYFQLRIDMKNFDLNSAFTFNLKAGLQPQSSDGHVSQWGFI